MLLNKVTPYEDEYITSIIERFLIANGFISYDDFHRVMGLKVSKLDFFHEAYPMSLIFELMEVKDWGMFYMKHSIYSFVAPFLSKGMQVKYLSGPFDLKGIKGYLRKNRTLKYCPACNEEKEYIRRSHNLPGVVACYKHKTPLYANGKPITNIVTDSDIKYAVYAKKFAEKELDISLEETSILLNIKQGLLVNYETALHFFMNKYPDLDSIDISIKVEDVNFKGYKTGMVTKNLVFLICNKCSKPLCTTIYGFKNDFRCPECQGKLTDEELFEEHLNVNGHYKKVTRYTFNTESITLQHIDCGKCFQTTPAKYYTGDRCPCEIKANENQFLESIGGGMHKNKKLAPLNKDTDSNKHNNEANSKVHSETVKKRKYDSTRITRNSKYMALLRYIEENYDSDQFIFEKELKNEVPDLCNPTSLLKLKKRNKLFSVKMGIYSLSNKTYTTEEIIQKLYIDRVNIEGFIARRTLLSKFGFINFHTIFEVCTSYADKESYTRFGEHRLYIHPLPSYYKSDKKEECQLADFINNTPYLKTNTDTLIRNVKKYVYEHNLDADFIIKNLKGEFIDAFKK